MQSHEQLFEKESINRLLIKLSLPIIFSMLVSELYNMIDTYFVGNYVNSLGIGALSVVYPLQRLIFALGTMIGIGTSTAFARAAGAKQYEKSKKIVQNGFSLVACIMVPLVIFTLIFKRQLLYLLGGRGEILTYAQEYLGIIILGALFFAWTVFISNWMIALGKIHLSIISMSLGAAVNFIVDWLLVKHLHYGVFGAALATAGSQVISFLFMFYHLLKTFRSLQISFRFKVKWTFFAGILAVGVSAFVVEAEDGILLTVLNNLLQNYVGNEGIIILAANTKVYMFLFVVMFGIASGMQPIAAYNIGAKNYDRLEEVLKKTVIIALLATVILWGLSVVYAPHFIQLFIKNEMIVPCFSDNGEFVPRN